MKGCLKVDGNECGKRESQVAVCLTYRHTSLSRGPFFCVEEDVWFNVIGTTAPIIDGTSLVVCLLGVQVALSF